MKIFDCPYLKSQVELTDERERHIAEYHPDLLPQHIDNIGETLSDPDSIRRSRRFANARLFTKWFDNVKGGKYIVVVVVADYNEKNRYWVVTSYIARKLSEGETEWTRS